LSRKPRKRKRSRRARPHRNRPAELPGDTPGEAAELRVQLNEFSRKAALLTDLKIAPIAHNHISSRAGRCHHVPKAADFHD
jgi:hypothetical protein